ncbi:putative transcription factor C2H2 family [Helianthus annuus]|nr:putative transcription factor C2H2 family [Helianthus annuus]
MVQYSFQSVIREANEAIVPEETFQPNSGPQFYLKLVVMFHYPRSYLHPRRHVLELFAPCYYEGGTLPNITAWVPAWVFMGEAGMPQDSVTQTFLRLIQCGSEMLRTVIPGMRPTPMMRMEEVQEEGNVCSVCLEDMVEGSMVGRVSCSWHVFHEKCINEWLKDNRSCPNCRLLLG